MNRRIFGKKSTGWLAAFGAVLGVKTAQAHEPFGLKATGQLETMGYWKTKPDNPASTDRYGIYIKLDSPVIQDDGTKLDDFILHISECRRAWHLKYRVTSADGVISKQSIHCDQRNAIHVNRKGLDQIQIGTAAIFLPPKYEETSSCP